MHDYSDPTRNKTTKKSKNTKDHCNKFHNFSLVTIEDFLDIHQLCRARDISIQNNGTVLSEIQKPIDARDLISLRFSGVKLRNTDFGSFSTSCAQHGAQILYYLKLKLNLIRYMSRRHLKLYSTAFHSSVSQPVGIVINLTILTKNTAVRHNGRKYKKPTFVGWM